MRGVAPGGRRGTDEAAVEAAPGTESPRVIYATATGQTRVPSPRQLPTDHDHDGEPNARSANIRVINRRHSRLDLGLVGATSSRAAPRHRTGAVDTVVPYQINRAACRTKSGGEAVGGTAATAARAARLTTRACV